MNPLDPNPVRGPQPAAGSSLHRRGLRGDGVGIAVIDSGVHAPGEFGRRLVAGPDFTADAGTIDECRDHTGHGTHLAGIAAGEHVGVAPGAHVISIKTAGAGGATDVDAVIAAVDWTVAHRHELSIGVLLLAFGADQLPAGQYDPLAAAVSRAWRAGVVVVTSAGNAGQELPLSTPAHIRDVITVAGAEQVDGRWVVSDFSDRGIDGGRPDVAAPGRSVVGPIAPDSEAADAPESSIVADGFVKGSGTSQAAAVVAGAAALLLQADAALTPDEVKQILCTSAIRIDDAAAGAGVLDLEVALAVLGSGLYRVQDAHAPTTAGAWAGLEWSSHGWRSHGWRGLEWSSHGWRSHGWRSHGWRGLEWSSHGWRSHGWRGLEWSSHGWRGLEWSSHGWRSHGWRGLEWSSHGWRSHGWRSHGWRGLEWSSHGWRSHGWRGLEWSSHGWRSHGWRGLEWSSHGWRSHGWRGLEWSSHGWRSHGWRSHGWRGLEWSSHGWRSHGWRSHGWRGLEWSSHGWRSHGWRSHGWRGLEWA